MKKINILKMIKVRTTILESQKIIDTINIYCDERMFNAFYRPESEILSIIVDKHKSFLENYDYLKYYLPNIDDLKQDLEILKNEVKEIENKYKNALNELESYECDHSVRFVTYHDFGATHKCIFCGKTIYDDNDCIKLNDEEYKLGCEFKTVFRIVKNILKDKDDNEEIDFISEFEKMNTKRKRKIRYYI